jgi:hypothetical protein
MVPLVIVTGCGFNHLEKYEFINGKDYPIYYGKYKMFETTNQTRCPFVVRMLNPG